MKDRNPSVNYTALSGTDATHEFGVPAKGPTGNQGMTVTVRPQLHEPLIRSSSSASR